ncbi:hypothetical protein ACFL27_20165, partial [candidate division CSSED10-310 bacterium]
AYRFRHDSNHLTFFSCSIAGMANNGHLKASSCFLRKLGIQGNACPLWLAGVSFWGVSFSTLFLKPSIP